MLCTADQHVMQVTINTPESRNSLTSDVLEGIARALDSAEADATVHALVLTGGQRIFASGADVRHLRELGSVEYLDSDRTRAWTRFARFGKPLIAAVAGPALGGGCELAMLCDLIVAADTAVFGQPEIRLGLLPGAGGTQRWARAAGRYHAGAAVLAGRTIDAWSALDHGLVAEVVPAERLLQAATSLAIDLAAFSPVAMRLARQALRAAEELPLTSALALERSLFATALASADHIEGIDAFLEKRRPRFEGR